MHNLSYITSNYTSLAAISFSLIFFVTNFVAKHQKVLLLRHSRFARRHLKQRQKMGRRLTAEQRLEISDAFKMFDKNGDGQISVEELGEAMKQAGQEMTDDELKDMIKAVDRNGNGKVEYTEFEDMMASQIGEPMTGDDLKFYFKKFDQNGDGFITSDELALVMKTFGGKSYSKKEIDDMIVEADTDSDGKVSYEEFVQMVTTKH